MSISIYDSYEGIDGLQMDQQTGSLTIRNITTTHSGLYTAQIMTAMATYKRFKVVVYDSSHSCGFTEAVIRLVISALVGVATVAVLVYDFRSERGVDASPQ
ncbi:hypothetical protein DPX16_0395 [Anabarilius grahami]|uniref:Uncharacterized protein n=1 Tax=Anabarilius grahami TaxID=495550 RepID=A0A3N0XWF6_ANAGA|nr:hypothetical protein DPX16_0395 [Anabarilius grahami]